MLAKWQAEQPIVISSQCIYMQCLIGRSLPQGAGVWREAGTQHLPPVLHVQASECSQQKEMQTAAVKFPCGNLETNRNIVDFSFKIRDFGLTLRAGDLWGNLALGKKIFQYKN